MSNWKSISLPKDKITVILFFFVLLLSLCQPALSQKKGKEKERRRKFHPIEIRNLNDTLVPTLVNKVASYTFTIDRDNFLLQRSYDLLSIEKSLPGIEDQIKKFRSIFERVGQSMDIQGLNTSVIILRDVGTRLSSFKTTLEGYKTALKESNVKVQKIITDSALMTVVTDSALRAEMAGVVSEGSTLDTAQKLMLAKINLLYSRVSVNQFEAGDIISDMVYLTIAKKTGLLTPERAPLLQSNPRQYNQTTQALIFQGLNISGKVIVIYLARRINLLVLAVMLIILIFIWCKSNIHRIKRRKDAAEVMKQILFLKRSLIISCLLALFTYFPLFFADPPSALLYSFEVLRLIMLSILIYPFLIRSFKTVWIIFSILWAYYALDDLLLHASYGERWMLFVAGILLVLICIRTIIQSKTIFTQISRSPVTKPLLIFCSVLTLLSLLFNLSGNFTLAKIMGIAAVQSLMLGIVLKVFCSMIVEAIYLQSEAYHESRFSEFLNFEKLKFSLRRTLWILACLVWIASLIRDLTLYSWFSKAVVYFLEVKRPIGKYHFTFASILIFIFIIWLSSIVSRIINYFFGYEKSVKTGKRSGLNSMALIFRLCVWAAGFLIAVAAAGIPLDKVSIMLGAFGVGIGFGLQTIVNNLVSGVILAFERPVQVGDQIEVGGRSGTVKEIGVRASKINNSEGADIIIPNGDMLSQHLINWTMQNRNKRVEFTLGVPYDTDLGKIKTLILEKLKTHEDILQYPQPSFIITDFAPFAVDMKIFFWVPDLSNSDPVRTNVMIEVKDILSKEGIQLQTRLVNPYDLKEKTTK